VAGLKDPLAEHIVDGVLPLIKNPALQVPEHVWPSTVPAQLLAGQEAFLGGAGKVETLQAAVRQVGRVLQPRALRLAWARPHRQVS